MAPGWDIIAVGAASLVVGLGLGGALFASRRRAARAGAASSQVKYSQPLPVMPKLGLDGETRRGDKMNRMNEAFARQLAAHDAAWDPDGLRDRVKEVYRKTLQAWTERDTALAATVMSKAMFERQKRLIDHMRAIGKRNVLKDIRIHDVDLVYVSDREGKKDDEFWAVVTAEMIDYDEIAEWEAYRLACGAMTEGADTELQLRVAQEFRATDEPTRKRELWKLLREGDAWMLDAISHDLKEVDDMPQPFSDDTYAGK